MGPPAQPPTFAQLEQAALHILRLISDAPGLDSTKLAVVGDLAVRKYLPESRRVSSIDFVLAKSSSPGRVVKEIVGHPMSPLTERSGAVFFRFPNGWEVEVKLIPDWLCPYVPAAARPIRDDIKSLPYISLADLIVFKADACGLRDHDQSKRQEARDAAALLDIASIHSSLQADPDKIARIEEALDDLIEFSLPEQDLIWWQRRLGKLTKSKESIDTILSELSEPKSPTSPKSPGTTSPRSSIYSCISRSSSSTSSVSAHSVSSSISSLASDDRSSKPTRPRKMSITNNKGPRHKRHPSAGVAPTTALSTALQQLEISRPASPGVSLTTYI